MNIIVSLCHCVIVSAVSEAKHVLWNNYKQHLEEWKPHRDARLPMKTSLAPSGQLKRSSLDMTHNICCMLIIEPLVRNLDDNDIRSRLKVLELQMVDVLREKRSYAEVSVLTLLHPLGLMKTRVLHREQLVLLFQLKGHPVQSGLC